MKARAPKQLIGWLGSRSRAGELAQQSLGPRVQSSKIDNDEQMRWLKFHLGAACDSPEMLERVYRWADKADDSVLALTDRERRLLDPLWAAAREKGYLEAPRAKLDPIEHMESEDLNTRIKWKTSKLLERAGG